ncbi:MAG: radical SAM protein [Bacteriovoracaceae bacterium]
MQTQEKFKNTRKTAKGEDRAYVELKSLETLWFNTGTLCNLECANCYIESSPTNDRLVYITEQEVEKYLLEIKEQELGTQFVGLTGGEPFLNPHIIPIIDSVLSYGHEVLILTNANRVINRHQKALLKIKKIYGSKLHLRVSLDHFTAAAHDQERGPGAFQRTLDQLKWLHDEGFNISIASRSLLGEDQAASRAGHQKMLEENGIALDLENKLVVFPEMGSSNDLPEITTACWGILDKKPEDQMCASERMVVKRKGDGQPVVMPCTLLAYEDQFVLGNSLKDSNKKVYLNHPFCAEFCVLGGASCSSAK